MYPFALERPATLAAALDLLASGGQPMAGGQTLLAALKQRLANPELLVDLSGIPELQGIQCTAERVTIAAMTRHQAVAAHPGIKVAIPGLARLAGGIGDRQVRAMGTIGGSLANNDPSACYPSAVLALGATIRTNRREIAADDFFRGLYETALEPGELIVSVSFPVPRAGAYAKFKQPASRYAMVGVFVARNGSGVRVAVTGAGNVVFRHAGLEAALTRDFSPAAVEGVDVDTAGINADLHASAEYRAQLIRVQTQRAVQQALAG